MKENMALRRGLYGAIVSAIASLSVVLACFAPEIAAFFLATFAGFFSLGVALGMHRAETAAKRAMEKRPRGIAAASLSSAFHDKPVVSPNRILCDESIILPIDSTDYQIRHPKGKASMEAKLALLSLDHTTRLPN